MHYLYFALQGRLFQFAPLSSVEQEHKAHFQLRLLKTVLPGNSGLNWQHYL